MQGNSDIPVNQMHTALLEITLIPAICSPVAAVNLGQ
jgi:hypothetical protein